MTLPQDLMSYGSAIHAYATVCGYMQRHTSLFPSRPRPTERSGQGYGEEPSESEAGPQAVQAAEQARQVCAVSLCMLSKLASQGGLIVKSGGQHPPEKPMLKSMYLKAFCQM